MLLLMQILLLLILVALGLQLARLSARSRHWPITFLAALAPIILLLLGHRITRLAFVPPISWVVDADVSPFLMAFCVPCLLATLLHRLAHPRQRVALALLTALMTIAYALLPILLPVLVRPSLRAGTTHLDPHGICLQTHSYTCGPAAAVTCLHQLNIPADESTLAIAALAAPAEGTDGHRLAAAINDLCSQRPLRCRFTYISSLDALTTPAIATIFSPHYGNHYVAVLQVTPDEVILGDPLSGRDRYSRDEFLDEWTGATLTFNPPSP